MKETQVNGIKGHRRFDETFKRHAVELSLRAERTVKAVAEELGISPVSGHFKTGQLWSLQNQPL
jgi:transposase-like protein